MGQFKSQNLWVKWFLNICFTWTTIFIFRKSTMNWFSIHIGLKFLLDVEKLYRISQRFKIFDVANPGIKKIGFLILDVTLYECFFFINVGLFMGLFTLQEEINFLKTLYTLKIWIAYNWVCLDNNFVIASAKQFYSLKSKSWLVCYLCMKDCLAHTLMEPEKIYLYVC